MLSNQLYKHIAATLSVNTNLNGVFTPLMLQKKKLN